MVRLKCVVSPQRISSEQGGGGLLFRRARGGGTLWGAASLPADGGWRVCPVAQWPTLRKGEALLLFTLWTVLLSCCCCCFFGFNVSLANLCRISGREISSCAAQPEARFKPIISKLLFFSVMQQLVQLAAQWSQNKRVNQPLHCLFPCTEKVVGASTTLSCSLCLPGILEPDQTCFLLNPFKYTQTFWRS